MSENCCQNCNYWKQYRGREWGNCHRYPPTWSDKHEEWGYPLTNPDEWCGEWTPTDTEEGE